MIPKLEDCKPGLFARGFPSVKLYMTYDGYKVRDDITFGVMQEVARIFARLDAEAEAVIADTGAALSQASARRLADMRYVGQGSEITVALPDLLDADAVRAAYQPCEVHLEQ